MKYRKRKIRAIVLSGLLVLVFSVTAFAKEGTTEETGSITIELADAGAGTSKENVRFAYTKVADVVDGKYELLEEYKQTNIDLNKLEYAEELKTAAEQLEKVAKKDGEIITDKNGKAVIENLPIGVYLLDMTDRGIYDNVTSLLIAIPTFDETDGQMDYDVTVTPKHTPIPPETVKTGDENGLGNWMFVCGVSAVMISILGGGCYVRKREKK